jgi:hypothetical protein
MPVVVIRREGVHGRPAVLGEARYCADPNVWLRALVARAAPGGPGLQLPLALLE